MRRLVRIGRFDGLSVGRAAHCCQDKLASVRNNTSSAPCRSPHLSGLGHGAGGGVHLGIAAVGRQIREHVPRIAGTTQGH